VHRPLRLQISPFLLVGHGEEQSLPNHPFLHMHFMPVLLATQSPLPKHGTVFPFDFPEVAFLKGHDCSQVRPPYPFLHRHFVLNPFPFFPPTSVHFPLPEHDVLAVLPGHSYWQLEPMNPCLHLHLGAPFFRKHEPWPPQVTFLCCGQTKLHPLPRWPALHLHDAPCFPFDLPMLQVP